MADGAAAGGKAIWVVRSGQVGVEGFDIEGTRVPSRKGAGIRFETRASERGDAAAWQAASAQCGAPGLSRAVSAVQGSFATGLTDGAGYSFAAIDRFALQLLCWGSINGRLKHAARADDLAALAPLAEIDPPAIFDYLYFHIIPPRWTIFKGVNRQRPHTTRWSRKAGSL